LDTESRGGVQNVEEAGGWGLGGVWAADVGALWLGELSAMEPGSALVVLSGSGWRLWPMSRMEDRAMSEVVCSECGVGAGEAARPRWPLWLRWLPWLAVAMVVVVAVGWGAMGERTTLKIPANELVMPFGLTEWSSERVHRASVDPDEAILLRAEVLAIADHFGNLIEPGAALHFGWDQAESTTPSARQAYGWPANWLVVLRSSGGMFSLNDFTWRDSQLLVVKSNRGFVFTPLSLAPMLLISIAVAWISVRCASRMLWLRERTGRQRCPAVVMAASFVVTMGVLLAIPVDSMWRNSWRPLVFPSASASISGMNLDSIRGTEGDSERARRMMEFVVRTLRPAVPSPSTGAPGNLAVEWVNPTEGTMSVTEFGEPWSSIGFGSMQFERPADGASSTRIAWPQWKWGGLYIYAGTRGFPSKAGFVVLEPGGLGAWTLVAMIAFWIAVGVRGLVQRRVIRRRELAGQCLTCGYAMGGGAG
jgi:hypothetical protein